MTDSKVNNILIPNVSKTSQKNIPNNKVKEEVSASEFRDLLNSKLKTSVESHDVKVSSHAAKRFQERSLDIDSNELLKIKDAIEKLKNKGGRDSLVVTDKAAYIVDVDKSTVVTAVDRESMTENVFTKIDSTLFMH